MVDSEETTATVTIKREDLDLFTVHDVVGKIRQIVGLTPEQEFRVTALIKRHVHYAKEDLYLKMLDWTSGGWAMDKEMLEDNLRVKVETHEKMKRLPDEQIVTWNVGSHVYTPSGIKKTELRKSYPIRYNFMGEN